MAANENARPAGSRQTEQRDGQASTAEKPPTNIIDQLPTVAASQVLPRHICDAFPEVRGEWARIGFRSLCSALAGVALDLTEGQADIGSQSSALALEAARVLARPAVRVVPLDGKTLLIHDGGCAILGDRSLYIRREVANE